MPNIQGLADGQLGLSLAGGAFGKENYSHGNQGSGDAMYHGLSFDASRSNSIYGNSSTVQPPALTCLICIKY